MVGVNGFCDERFAPIRDLFGAGLERGIDEGASYAVAVDGRLVVDLWGGCRDLARSKPWEADTVVGVASTSKVIVAIATLMLWDRGLLDIDEPIATYWPGFAQNGKAAVTPRQVLLHNSGLPGFGCIPTLEDTVDLDRMAGIIERAPLWYEPGTVTCYHSGTFGHILGELVRRVSALPFVQFVSEEITEPLGADFHYMFSASRDVARVAEPWPATGPQVALHPMGARVVAELAPMVGQFERGELPPCVDPGGSGLTNARALVRVGSIMALQGEVDGRRYLSRRAVEDTASEHSYAEDQILGRVRRGLFFALDAAEFPAPTPTTIHWGGHGGSWVTMDPASGISCAYTPNRFLVGDEWLRRQAAQWQVLTEVLRSIR
jgi:CubicO group peptidase (beta-lactamase class C family)